VLLQSNNRHEFVIGVNVPRLNSAKGKQTNANRGSAYQRIIIPLSVGIGLPKKKKKKEKGKKNRQKDLFDTPILCQRDSSRCLVNRQKFHGERSARHRRENALAM
jgi:hypothetical protein